MKTCKYLLILLLGGIGTSCNKSQHSLPTPNAPAPDTAERAHVRAAGTAKAEQTPGASKPESAEITPELEAGLQNLYKSSLKPVPATDPRTPPVPEGDEPANRPKADQPVPATQAKAVPNAAPGTPSASTAPPTMDSAASAPRTIQARELDSPLADKPESITPLAARAPLAGSAQSPNAKSAPKASAQEARARKILQNETSKSGSASTATRRASATDEEVNPALPNALLRDFFGRQRRSMFDVGGGVYIEPPPPAPRSSSTP